jgi:hypothetical protein
VDELVGDPRTLAPIQFALANRLCGECRDYHALWPYRRLARFFIGLDGDVPFLAPVLAETTPLRGRVLIAGVADAGLLALTEAATRERQAILTVADRCPTPLAVCERYAASRDFAVGTINLDLGRTRPSARYDVIFTHGFMRFVPDLARAEFFRGLKDALLPSGRIVAVEMLPRAKENKAKDLISDLVAAVRAADVALPETEEAFRDRLAREISQASGRMYSAPHPDELAASLRDAGYGLNLHRTFARKQTATTHETGFLSTSAEVVVGSPG